MAGEALIARVCRYADAHNAPETPFETGIDGFTLVRCRAPTALEAMIYSPLLCLVLQGRKESYLGETPVSFGKGESLIVSLDVPTVSRVTEASVGAPYVALALELDLGVIRSLYDEVGEAEIADGQARAIESGEADAALVETMGRLFDLVERPLERRVLVPLLRREIHFPRALQGADGDDAAAVSEGSAPAGGTAKVDRRGRIRRGSGLRRGI